MSVPLWEEGLKTQDDAQVSGAQGTERDLSTVALRALSLGANCLCLMS